MIIEVKPFVLDCTDKEQACKVLEEAAEAFGAWQTFEEWLPCFRQDCKQCRDRAICSSGYWQEIADVYRSALADEIADTIQAACNLAERYGIDVAAAMQRCEERNRERGRYD